MDRDVLAGYGVVAEPGELGILTGHDIRISPSRPVARSGAKSNRASPQRGGPVRCAGNICERLELVLRHAPGGRQSPLLLLPLLDHQGLGRE